MSQSAATHHKRWFGLPGAFMAGCVSGALIAAVGYAHFDQHGRHLERLAQTGPAPEEIRTQAALPPAGNARIAARF